MGDIFDFKNNYEGFKNGLGQMGDGLQKAASGVGDLVVGKLQMDAAIIGMAIDSQPAVIIGKSLINENSDRLPSGGGLATGLAMEAARTANKVVDHVKSRPVTSAAEMVLMPPLFVADALISEPAAKPKQPEVKTASRETPKKVQDTPVGPVGSAKPAGETNTKLDIGKPVPKGPVEEDIVPKAQTEIPNFNGTKAAKGGSDLSKAQSNREYDGIAEAKAGPPKADKRDGGVAAYKPIESKEAGDERFRRARNRREERAGRRNPSSEEEGLQRQAKEIDKAVQDYEKSLRESLPKKLAHHIPEMTQSFKARLQNDVEKERKEDKQEGKPKIPQQLESERKNSGKAAELAPGKDVMSASRFEETKQKFAYNESTYAQALQQAAEKGKPLVLIAGTKDSAASFLAEAGADAKKGDAVYVFVARENLSKDNPLAQYLDNQVGRDHASNSNYCFASVFRVSKDAAGNLSNSQPEYAATGPDAFKREQVQSAVGRIDRIAQAERNRYQAVESVPQAYYQPQSVVVSDVNPSYQVPYQQYQVPYQQFQPQPAFTQQRGLPILRRFR